MHDAIAKHCDELNRCNQRGGRMLSIFDLLAAETLDPDLAAYLMARISTGSSFAAGSVPGGAGKTTVMCALLNFVPVDVSLIPATSQAVYEAANARVLPSRSCYVCHEIGSGNYFAYLWADALRAYCSLFEHGHILATNLHADTPRQAREQICNTNGVPGEHFNKFELLIFLRIENGYPRARRWIEEVYSGDGSSGYELIFHANKKRTLDENAKHYLADPEYVAACRDFLTKISPNVRTIEDTRRQVVEFLRRNNNTKTD
ncbi:MAG: hypothetical protein A2168_07385 [Planctomycetes bacterium RBG_13_50_24]|nr:MAG: hypothetical protein A2168_07385 [Planctomycetes bacterium RBG_13_50_24]